MADYRRTFWQRYSLQNGVLRQDYMGNVEYEMGSVPRAQAKLLQLEGNVERRTLKPPFKIEYYPSARPGEDSPLQKPNRLTFIGATQDIDAELEKLNGKTIDNKAGLMISGRDRATLVWLVVNPRDYGEGGGIVILNDSWIDELDQRDNVNEFLAGMFGINPEN